MTQNHNHRPEDDYPEHIDRFLDNTSRHWQRYKSDPGLIGKILLIMRVGNELKTASEIHEEKQARKSGNNHRLLDEQEWED